MNELARALESVAVTLKHSDRMLASCPWWKLRNKWELRVASGILSAVYDMLYALAVEASRNCKHTGGHDANDSSERYN